MELRVHCAVWGGHGVAPHPPRCCVRSGPFGGGGGVLWGWIPLLGWGGPASLAGAWPVGGGVACKQGVGLGR